MTQQSQKKDIITQPNQNQEMQHPIAIQMETTNQVLGSNDLSKEKQEKPSAKFTCRYEIQIDNESKFQVARRIIGTKGSNMKRIVDLCSKDMPLYLQSQDIIKLRLRGRGSGFKEGPYQAESSEPLHLCISSRYYDKYLLACEECEALLHKVYREYSEFYQQNNIEMQQLVIKRQENPTQNVPPAYHEYSMSDQLNPQEIEYWIQIRNEARRVSDFNEADRIRSLLNQRGIILVDAKGLPCATTWKYSY